MTDDPQRWEGRPRAREERTERAGAFRAFFYLFRKQSEAERTQKRKKAGRRAEPPQTQGKSPKREERSGTNGGAGPSNERPRLCDGRR